MSATYERVLNTSVPVTDCTFTFNPENCPQNSKQKKYYNY
jgi:hypothetical protein